MADSTHRVEIVPVTLEKHPNADSLSIVRIEGYQAVVRTDDWQGQELGAYIPPDSLVPLDRPEFEWLKDPNHPERTHARIRAQKLRGEWSMGLLIQAPAGVTLGDDVAELLGVEHYEPPEPGLKTGGETDKAPQGAYPKYDVEAFRRYGRHAFVEGEAVWVTEKIHGTSGRWLWDGERFHCGSRTEWKRQYGSVQGRLSLWWSALAECPALENFLRMNPWTAVYGEVYGQVQKGFQYGVPKGQCRIAVFDILHNGRWVNAVESQQFQPNPEGPPAWTLPWVPLLASCEFNFETLLGLAEGQSLVSGATNVREGIVVKPHVERWDSQCGRVNLKIVSNEFLRKS